MIDRQLFRQRLMGPSFWKDQQFIFSGPSFPVILWYSVLVTNVRKTAFSKFSLLSSKVVEGVSVFPSTVKVSL